jgi:methyl-accepting chemotaxis protein
MLIVSLVAIVGSVCLYQLNQIAKPLKYDIPETVKIINESSHLDGLAQFIRYYDEVLTQSARNFAFTQNKKWEQRYRDVEPKLNIIIKEAIERGDEKDKEYFSSVNKANLALVEMEYKAIELVNNAQAENAVKILESNEYWSQKNIYEQGLRDYVQRKGAQYDEALEISTQEVESANNKTKNMIGMSTLLVLIFVVVAVILSIGIGLFIFWSISNPLARLKTAAAQIGAGKLDTQIEINSSDEIGELAISFNKMAEDLQKVFTKTPLWVFHMLIQSCVICELIDTLLILTEDLYQSILDAQSVKCFLK